MPPIGDQACVRMPCSRVQALQRRLLEVRVDFDLVDRRHDRGLGQQTLQVLGHEVADPDRAHLAVGEQRLQRAVRVEGEVESARQRLVEDQQVELIDAELAGALVERVQGLLVAVVADPDLRLDEHVVAGDAGAADPLADLALVAVRRGRVDEAIGLCESGLDGARGLVRRALEHAQAEGGHLDPVVQREKGAVTCHRRSPFNGCGRLDVGIFMTSSVTSLYSA